VENVVELKSEGAPAEDAVITVPIGLYYAKLTGAALTLLGIVSLIPPLTRGDTLLDIMHVTPSAAILYLVTGLAGIAVGVIGRKRFATAYALAVGFIYVVYFSLINIVFGNMSGTLQLDTTLHIIQWVLFVALQAGLMLSGWIVAALSALQRGDRATRRYRTRRPWLWMERIRF
jgi:uncharacterized membrane protein YuzA (DUF378 family)